MARLRTASGEIQGANARPHVTIAVDVAKGLAYNSRTLASVPVTKEEGLGASSDAQRRYRLAQARAKREHCTVDKCIIQLKNEHRALSSLSKSNKCASIRALQQV
jgi:hypothetical protein